MAWRAWYDDGSTYDSGETTWQSLPAEGMVGVVVYHEPPYRTILDAGDWYWLEDGEIHLARNHSEWGKWAPRPDVDCQSCVKRSGALEDDAFEAVQAEMMEARTWP